MSLTNSAPGRMFLFAPQPIFSLSCSAKRGVKYLEDINIARRLFLGWCQLICGNALLIISKGNFCLMLEVGRITGSMHNTPEIPAHAWRNVSIWCCVTALSLHALSNITGEVDMATTTAPCPSPTIILGLKRSTAVNNVTRALLIYDFSFLVAPSSVLAFGSNQ